MAGIGARYVIFAPFSGEEPTDALPKYGDTIEIGELIQANVTINRAEGDLYANDIETEHIEEFVSADCELEVDQMTLEKEAALFGSTQEDGESVDDIQDTAPYGGLCYIQTMVKKGVRSFRAYYYPKAKAALPDTNAQTKGSSINFQTVNTTLKITAPNTGKWRYRKTFTTYAEAKTWCDTKLKKDDGEGA